MGILSSLRKGHKVGGTEGKANVVVERYDDNGGRQACYLVTHHYEGGSNTKSYRHASDVIKATSNVKFKDRQYSPGTDDLQILINS